MVMVVMVTSPVFSVSSQRIIAVGNGKLPWATRQTCPSGRRTWQQPAPHSGGQVGFASPAVSSEEMGD